MSLWSAFCGGAYQALSPWLAADEAINVFLETQYQGAKKTSTLYGTPGLKSDGATVSEVACRGWFAVDQRVWVTVGALLYERTSPGVYVSRGAIPNDGAPVSYGLVANTLGIVGGGALNVLNLTTNVLTPIVLPFSNPVMIVIFDGYGMINERDTANVWFSTPGDITLWAAADLFVRQTGDHVIGLAQTKDRLWTFGSQHTQLYYDTGDQNQPFLPYPGSTLLTGAASPWSIGVYNDVVTWVGISPQGQGRVVRAVDAQAETISTPPIDLWLSKCPHLMDVETLIYQQAGHPFVAITCPSNTDPIKTYVYDHREGLWHARAGWDDVTGDFTRWRARGSAATIDQVFAGDYATGDLYVLDLNTFDDAGRTLVRQRTAPYLSDENQWLFLQSFELGIQPGVGTAAAGLGHDPVVELFVSRDGAQTFATAGVRALGAIGRYLTRVVWQNLGRARADRIVLRVRQTAPVRCVWGPGAWLRAVPGDGRL